MAPLSPKQQKTAIAIALAVYVLVMAGLGAWLFLNREITQQKRSLQTPTVTAWLPGKEPKVPDSWAGKKPQEEQAAPEAKPEAPAAQEPASETPAAPEASPVATETPAPAEATPSVDETAAPPATAPATVAKWQKYARPFDARDNRPRIALVIADLGLSTALSDAAIKDLPPEVTLAFSVLTEDLEAWITKARTAGHETVLAVPMEPENYPQNDPGPNALLLGLPAKENVERLRRGMARADGYVAVMPSMGEKFVLDEKQMAPVLDTVHDEDVMVLDGTLLRDSMIAPLSRLGRIPFARADQRLDAAISSRTLQQQLEALEVLAREKGYAVGLVVPYPAAFTQLAEWAAKLTDKGFALAPVTALSSQNLPAAASVSADEPVPENTAQTTVATEGQAPAAMPPAPAEAPPAAPAPAQQNAVVKQNP